MGFPSVLGHRARSLAICCGIHLQQAYRQIITQPQLLSTASWFEAEQGVRRGGGTHMPLYSYGRGLVRPGQGAYVSASMPPPLSSSRLPLQSPPFPARTRGARVPQMDALPCRFQGESYPFDSRLISLSSIRTSACHLSHLIKNDWLSSLK